MLKSLGHCLINGKGLERSHPIIRCFNFQHGGRNLTFCDQIVDLEFIGKEMAEKFYSVALTVLVAILVRWCVSLSSYSGKSCQK